MTYFSFKVGLVLFLRWSFQG